MRTIAFIDAAQFRPAVFTSRINTQKKFDWILFKAWLSKIADATAKQNLGLFDVHYFDCMTDTAQTTKEGFHSFLRNQGFQLHFTELHEKQKQCKECKNTYYEMEQKGVDVGIAITMVRLAYCNAYDQAILCSGDGDFAELVSTLRHGLGKRTVVVGWQNGISPILRDNAYKTYYINEHFEEFLRDQS